MTFYHINYCTCCLQGSEVEPEPGLSDPGGDERARPTDGTPDHDNNRDDNDQRHGRQGAGRDEGAEQDHRHYQAQENKGLNQVSVTDPIRIIGRGQSAEQDHRHHQAQENQSLKLIVEHRSDSIRITGRGQGVE